MAAHVVYYDPCAQVFIQSDTAPPCPSCCCRGIGGTGLFDFPRKAGEGEMSGDSFGPWESRLGIGSPRTDNGDAAREIGDLGGDLGTGGLGTRRHIGRAGDGGG